MYSTGVTDPGRTRHYAEFYGGLAGDDTRPLWTIIGNCQAEALRHTLDSVPDRPYRTVRVPPVHELDAADLPHLHALLRQTAVLLCQPIRPDYRDLPLGTDQLAAAAPAGTTLVRWPVIRYAGLYPFQVIVRRPSDRSVVPPAVPYHDLRTVTAALAGHSPTDPWDVDVEPRRFRAVAEASAATLADRERRDTDVGVSDVLIAAGSDAAHAINHPGNTVLTVLAQRVLAALGVPGSVELGEVPVLGSVYVPLEQRVLDALDVTGSARTDWIFHGEVLTADEVHCVQMRWYVDNPDFPKLAVERHRVSMDLLGLW